MQELGANILTVHYEACTHLHRTLQAIKAEGNASRCGPKPTYAVSLLVDDIKDIDLVCIMSDNPGWHGNPYREHL